MNAPLSTDLAEPPLPKQAVCLEVDLYPTINIDVLSESIGRMRFKTSDYLSKFPNLEEIPGIDLEEELIQHHPNTSNITLNDVKKLIKGTNEREARDIRSALYANPTHVKYLLKELFLCKVIPESPEKEISDECYGKLKHVLRGMQNVLRFAEPPETKKRLPRLPR